MKTRKPLRRTKPLRQRRREGADVEREVRPWAANLSASTVKPLHQGSYGGGASGVAVAKENASQHSGYMEAVRGLGYCVRCGKVCRPQFCHRDEGKGIGIKTDCREGWAGCADCHHFVGTSGTLPREERRAEDLEMGRRTRAAVKAAGTWPARLPAWEAAC